MGDLREPNGGVTEERSAPSTSLVGPSSSGIVPERWARAEKATGRIICQVQPTVVSQERRKEVVDYVQRLIKGRLGCEEFLALNDALLALKKVFPYGSVPLKTYLPDGDIDLTAFGGASVEDALVNDIVSVLEGEDQNKAAEFVVDDVQLIRAEVKVVKCIVQNIVVDISFNQIGGLCTLCFLEQVDRLIGKDHLFKRSIILIKAWCYYESRILGAHHGLISTYALETLVLYIFHVFHSTLSGPLAVLYKFLDYFSKFDWDNYCVSINGPIHLSSLPDIVAEIPENGGDGLLLGNDFFRYCVDTFSVPCRGADIDSRTFLQKHLNIVDPLKEHNNLGRSVSKGNFYRIRSAFTYGARKLGRILLQPEDNVADEICKFFSNTLDRHGSGQRPDVQDPDPVSSSSGCGPALSMSETKSHIEEKAGSELKSADCTESADCTGTAGDCKHNHDGSSMDVVNSTTAAGMQTKNSRTANGQQIGSGEAFHPSLPSKADGANQGSALSGIRFAGDAKDLATIKTRGLKFSNGSSEVSHLGSEERVSPPGSAHHVPHLYFSNAILSNGKHGTQGPPEERGLITGNNGFPAPFHSNHGPVASPASTFASPEPLNLSDLSGDYDSHFKCLQFGRWCYDYASSLHALPMPPMPPPHFQSMRRNGFSNGSANGVVSSPMLYPLKPMLIPGAGFGLEEMPKPRGTGTYFPNMNRSPQGYRPSAVKGRNQVPARSPRSNGRPMTFTESPVDHGDGISASSEIQYSSSPLKKVHPNANGLILQTEGVEFGSVGPIPLGEPSTESSKQARTAASLPQTSSQGLETSPRMQRPKPVLAVDKD
ncbi:hypothetical protein RJ640_010336, partial [Escallonia rubra]